MHPVIVSAGEAAPLDRHLQRRPGTALLIMLAAERPSVAARATPYDHEYRALRDHRLRELGWTVITDTERRQERFQP